MKIVTIADLHGTLPEIPPCDLLLIGGDLCPWDDHSETYQLQWLELYFRPWLETIPATHIVGIAGNHDFAFQSPMVDKYVRAFRWNYLNQSSIEIDGIKIFGSPWQPDFYDWAFQMPDEDLSIKWDAIPNDTDVLITHGPPFGLADLTHLKERAGSKSLCDAIRRVQPKLMVCGHIHAGRGLYWPTPFGEDITLINAALYDDYGNFREPIEIGMDFGTT